MTKKSSKSAKTSNPKKVMGARSSVPLITKHRPLRLTDLIGMDATAKALSTSFEKGNIPNGFLLLGTTGCGKTTTARAIARTVMCENLSACGKCASCKVAFGDILKHMDYEEINCGESGKIDEIRNVLAMSRNAPLLGKMRVVVLDEVHRLSGASAEALLKPLEEPSESTLYILATTESNAIKETIKNRCQVIRVHPAEPELLAGYLTDVALEEECSLPKDVIHKLMLDVAQLSGGAIRKSLGYLDQVLGLHRSDPDADIDSFLEEIHQDILNNTDVDVLAAQKLLLGVLFGNPKSISQVLANPSEYVRLSHNMLAIAQYLIDYTYEARGSNVYHIPAYRECAKVFANTCDKRGTSVRERHEALSALIIGCVELHGKIMTFACPERPLITAHAFNMLNNIRAYTKNKNKVKK